MSWGKIRFGNLYAEDSRNGLTKPSRIRGKGYKMINMGELFANDRIYDLPMELVPLKDNEKITAKIKVNDLLFARQSLVLEGAGKCSIVMEVSPLTVFESHIIRVRLRSDIASPMFYYYFFRSSFSPIKSIISQCAQAGIRASDLKEIDVVFPPLETQQKIASILSAYDDLIENNRRQIKLLEEAAQRLYKEWFVDLRFPGHENVKIINGVPEGWKKGVIGSLIKKTSKTKQIMATDYLKAGNIPVIDQSRDFIAGYTNDTSALISIETPVIVFGDHTRILKYIQFSFARGADGTQIIITNNKNMPQSLLYCSLVNVDLSNYHYARHFKYLKAEEIIIPTNEIAISFDKLASLIFKQIQKMRERIIRATEARDRLLPKLMSGEIKV